MRYDRIAAVVLLGLGFLAFPGRGTAQNFAGSYTLFQVNGEALPVQTDEENGCREEVMTGTLTIETGGTWRFEYTERKTCGNEVREDRDTETGRFVTEGTTIVFSDDDESDSPPDEIDIEELGVGSLSGDVLSVTLEDRRTVLSFRR